MSHLPPARRTDTIDWAGVSTSLDAQGWVILPKLLTGEECDATAGLYGGGDGFGSHVIMARHGFGRGEYRYFSYPLPRLVQALRTGLYPRLAPIANGWHERMGMDVRFPADHGAFIERCHQAGQTRPTPLLLQWRRGLQLPASGPIRRARLSAPGRHPALRARRGLRGWQVHADGAAATHADAGCRRAVAKGRRRAVCGQHVPG